MTSPRNPKTGRFQGKPSLRTDETMQMAMDPGKYLRKKLIERLSRLSPIMQTIIKLAPGGKTSGTD